MPKSSYHDTRANARRWVTPLAYVLLFFALAAVQPVSAQDNAAAAYRWQGFVQLSGTFSTDVSGTARVTFDDPPGVFPLAERKSFSKNARLFAGLRFNLTKANQFEVSYSYNPGSLTLTLNGPPLTGNLPFVSPFRIHTVSFNYVRNLPVQGRFQPFITGGIGFTAFAGSFVTEYVAAGNLGIGLDIGLTRRLVFRLEQRVFLQGMPRRVIANVPTDFDIGGTSVNYVPSVGLVFRF